MAQGGSVYIWQMPVTTTIARDVGVEVAGSRRFVAEIDFRAEAGLVTCRLGEGERHILTLRLRHRPPVKRDIPAAGAAGDRQGDRLLRATTVTRIPRAAVVYDGRGVELDLGDHRWPTSCAACARGG